MLRLPSREGSGYMRERQLDMYSLALETSPMGLQFLMGAKKNITHHYLEVSELSEQAIDTSSLGLKNKTQNGRDEPVLPGSLWF